MDYKSLSEPIKQTIATLPTPFFLFDLDRVGANLRLRPARRISSNTAMSPSSARFWGSSPMSRWTCPPKTSGAFGSNCDEGNRISLYSQKRSGGAI